MIFSFQNLTLYDGRSTKSKEGIFEKTLNANFFLTNDIHLFESKLIAS